MAVEQNEQRRRTIGVRPGLGADETFIGEGSADGVQRMMSAPDGVSLHHVLGFTDGFQRQRAIQCGDRPLHVHEAHHLGFGYPKAHCAVS